MGVRYQNISMDSLSEAIEGIDPQRNVHLVKLVQYGVPGGEEQENNFSLSQFLTYPYFVEVGIIQYETQPDKGKCGDETDKSAYKLSIAPLKLGEVLVSADGADLGDGFYGVSLVNGGPTEQLIDYRDNAVKSVFNCTSGIEFNSYPPLSLRSSPAELCDVKPDRVFTFTGEGEDLPVVGDIISTLKGVAGEGYYLAQSISGINKYICEVSGEGKFPGEVTNILLCKGDVRPIDGGDTIIKR